MALFSRELNERWNKFLAKCTRIRWMLKLDFLENRASFGKKVFYNFNLFFIKDRFHQLLRYICCCPTNFQNQFPWNRNLVRRNIILHFCLSFAQVINSFSIMGETGARRYKGWLQGSLNFWRWHYHFKNQVADVCQPYTLHTRVWCFFCNRFTCYYVITVFVFSVPTVTSLFLLQYCQPNSQINVCT